MHPSTTRRVHSAEFKALVLAQCAEPGASVAAVSRQHGLNANLVQKWLAGRGLKRCGLQSPDPCAAGDAETMQFVPVEIAPPRPTAAALAESSQPSSAATSIRIELRRGATQLTVTWPSQDAATCIGWLREIGASVLP